MNWKAYIKSPECWDEATSLAQSETDTLSYAVENAVEEMVNRCMKRMVDGNPKLKEMDAMAIVDLRNFVQRRVWWAASEWMEENYTGNDWS